MGAGDGSASSETDRAPRGRGPTYAHDRASVFGYRAAAGGDSDVRGPVLQIDWTRSGRVGDLVLATRVRRLRTEEACRRIFERARGRVGGRSARRRRRVA